MEYQEQLWFDEFFKTIFTESGVGIIIKAADGKMVDCNPAFESMLGYSVDEIRQKDYLQITYPSDKVTSSVLFGDLVAGRRKNYSIEKRYVSKSGEIVWTRMTASAVYNPARRVQFVIGMVENISTRKQIESELDELRKRLMQGRETERLRLAQDLHDGPLQEIMAVTFQLQPLESSLSQDADRAQLQAIQESLRQLTRSLRDICGELRPPTLIPFGLEKAIRSHAAETQAAHPEVEISLELAQDGQNLSEQVRIILFRIYQEAFHNILRHAKATQVFVRLSLDEEQATLDVEDNGVGFEIPSRWIRLARQGHLGLVGALERAEEVGGKLEISSTPGKGTRLHAVVPLTEDLQVS